MGESIAEEVGRALRRARSAQGLTLREVATRSGGAFKPTAVAAYERAERSISLQRFCDLAEVCGVRPELLLAEIMIERFGRGQDMVDLARLERERASRADAEPVD